MSAPDLHHPPPSDLIITRATTAPADIFITDPESFELASTPPSSQRATFAAPPQSTAPTSHRATNSSSSNLYPQISRPVAIRKGINNRNTTATGQWRTSEALTDAGTDFMHGVIDDNEQRIDIREEMRRRSVVEGQSDVRPGTRLGGGRRGYFGKRGEQADPKVVFEAFVDGGNLGREHEERKSGLRRNKVVKKAVKWVKGVWEKGVQKGRKVMAPREPYYWERPVRSSR